MLLSVGAAAWPSKTPCDRPLDVGVSFMQKPSIASDAIDATFVGKQCGDSFAPNEILTAEVAPGSSSQFMLQLEGGGADARPADHTMQP